jgi:hypothetical protein
MSAIDVTKAIPRTIIINININSPNVLWDLKNKIPK